MTLYIEMKNLLSLVQDFNKFYSLKRINSPVETTKNANMAIAYTAKKIIDSGLALLGIQSVERM